jgi:hypothetical protein
VPPGKEGKITLAVEHTQGYTGEVSKFATVTTNDSENPKFGLTLHVYFKGNPMEVRPTPATYTAPVTKVGPFDISPSDKWVTAVIRGSTLPTTLTFKNHDAKPAHITSVIPGGDSFNLTLRTIQDGKDYGLYVVTNPTLKPGHYVQTAELITDSPDTPKIPITLDLTVYPDVIVTPGQIRLPPISTLETDISKLVVPPIYVRKVRGTGLKITNVTTTLPFLHLDLQPELAGQNYIIRCTLDQTKRPKAGSYDGIVKVETDDQEAPVLQVAVHFDFQG